jgi:hypothetical protein
MKPPPDTPPFGVLRALGAVLRSVSRVMKNSTIPLA